MKKNKKILISSLIALSFIGQTVPAMAQTIDIDQAITNNSTFASINKYERQIVKVNNENMSYIQLGNINSNKSIVIIHGSAYSASGMISYGETYEKEGFNVVLVDLPGHYSNISQAKDQFSELGDSVASLINKLVCENKLNNKSEIQGWSLGGSVALDIASRYPEHVKSIGLIDSSPNWYGIRSVSVTEDTKIATMSAFIQRYKSQAIPQSVTNSLITDVPNVIAPAEACNHDFAIDKVLNVDDELNKIKVPIYDFFGADDEFTTLDVQKDMLSQVEHSHLHVSKGYNHFAVLENPQLVHDSLEAMHNTSN